MAAHSKQARAPMTQNKRIALAIVLIVAIGIFVFCGIQLIGILTEYSEGDAVYSEMQNEYMSDTQDTGPLTDDIMAIDASGGEGDSGEGGETYTDTGGEFPGQTVLSGVVEQTYTLPDFEQLRSINSECIGWLRIYDTNIDYPVAKTKNNSYYLTHTIKRTENSAGTLFMDYRNATDLSDENTVIYGHNMKSGSMFNNLMNYKSASFFNDHKYIKLFIYRDDRLEEINLRVFSAYLTTADSGYVQRNFVNDEEYRSFLDTITNASILNSGVKVSTERHILTLSTCDHTEYENGRFVVHAMIV